MESDKADALKKQCQQINFAQEIQNSEFYVLSNALFNKQKGAGKRKKKKKKATYKRGISTMSWMRQHSNSSMRSSHSVPEKEAYQRFSGFSNTKRKHLSTEEAFKI